MTNEELQETVQAVSKSLSELSGSENLTGEERKRKIVLSLRKEALEKIKEARQKKDLRQELNHTITYSVLTSWGEKHPFLVHLLRAKLGFNLME